MGIRYRKSKKIGPVRITASKSGLSASIGVKGLRVTKLANGRVRTTASIPGTGISYVKDMSSKKEAKSVNSTKPIFPYVHSDFSFWACIVACFGCLLGAYDSGSAMYLFISVGFLLIAISFKRRNKREREAYDLAVANHIAQQQEEEKMLKSIFPGEPDSTIDSYDQKASTFENCVFYAVQAGAISVSSIQLKMRVGYSQAARWMDEMEALGIVGPYKGAAPREVLFLPDSFPGFDELIRRKKERQSNCVDPYGQPNKRSNIQFDKKSVTVQVVGETFINEDGTLRQQILKDAFDMGCLGVTKLETYSYQGNPAIHVLYNGEIVGNIGKTEINLISVLLDWIFDVDLSVDRFIPHDNQDRSADSRRAYVDQYIYFAEIKIHYLCPK